MERIKTEDIVDMSKWAKKLEEELKAFRAIRLILEKKEVSK